MTISLSPFRYAQLARYVLTRWFDAPHVNRWKGKSKALSPTWGLAMAGGGNDHILRASVEERRQEPRAGYEVLGEPSTSRNVLPRLSPDPNLPPEPTEIYRLMNDPRLADPRSVKPPREIVVLCHGLYGFSTSTPIPLFPSLRLHYWAAVLQVLRDQMGCKVMVVGVKGTGSIKERAEQMHEFLKTNLPKGTGVNFVAHSMGGLDCRHLISTIKPTTYTPLSLTSIGTPHRGSPFMDWCAANIGVGSVAAAAAAVALKGSVSTKSLPYSLKSPLLTRPPGEGPKKDEGGFGHFTSALTNYLLSIFDTPAYGNLTTTFLRDHFNPATLDDSRVKYTSVSGRIAKMSVLHPLWFPKLVLDAAAENGYAEDNGSVGKGYEGNDGLVSVSSSKWGEFLGSVDETHHWDLRGEGGLFPQGGSISTSPEGRPDKSAPGGWDWKGSLDDSSVREHLDLDNKAKYDKALADAEKIDKHKPSTSPASSWDMAQVGEVLDWVSDLLPGKSDETQKKQLADAQKEKDRDEARLSGKEVEKKRKKEKFNLGRFYGGLMIKLREDGF